MHVLVGMQQIVDGKVDPGRNHWEIARQQYTFAPNVIYNLIEISVKDDPSLDPRKFELVEVAMGLFPNQPALKVTRGSFFLQDKKYQEALEDFEEALADETFSKVLANQKRCLEGLIECCGELGDEKKRSEYRVRLGVIEDMLANRKKEFEEELEKETDEDTD